jgi:hypothetical protein
MKKNILLGLFFALIINLQSFGTVTFIMKNYSAQTGTQITIPVKVTGFTNIVSIQGTIQFDPTKLAYSSVQDFGFTEMNSSSFGYTQTGSGKLTFTWIEGSTTGISKPDSTTIFSIKFDVSPTNTGISLLSFVTTPTTIEVVDGNFNTIAYTLVGGSVNVYTTVSIPEIQNSGFGLQQNEPNPFSEQTRILFALPEDGEVSLEIYDILGNKVSDYKEFMQAGNRNYNLNTSNLHSGTYFYKLSCGKYSDIRKMLVVK